jgi:hypothetical protein
VFMSVAYFYLFRIFMLILIPWVILAVFGIYILMMRYQERARTRRFENLPTYEFDSYSKIGKIKQTECWIWLEDYISSTMVVVFPWDSKHVFHKECIQQWFQNNDTCPIDRQPLR